MKSYLRYRNCCRYTGCHPWPVTVHKARRWTTMGSLLAMKPVQSPVAFSSRRLADHREFDRIFTLVSDGVDWGVQCDMYRPVGQQQFWGIYPVIEVHENEDAAKAAFLEIVDRYSADPEWRKLDDQAVQDSRDGAR